MRLFFAIIIALSSAFTFRSGAEFYFTAGKNHDFPDAKQGITLVHEFPFTNKGDSPLIISDYKVACSCTRLIFPKEPILPGQKNNLRLEFDTTGKHGFQSRKIQIFSNTKKTVKLSFRVFVLDEK